jgi:hypothetical protein
MRKHGTRNRHWRRGLSLLEAMMMVVIMGVVSLGFGIALQSNARVPAVVDKWLAIHTYLVDKMEDLASLNYATLAAANGTTDTVNVWGQNLARTVTVQNVDGDGNGSVDSDFIEVKVTIGDQYLKTRVAQP